MTGTVQALVAIGANLGDTVAQIRKAWARLQSLTDTPILCSSMWKTQPVDCPPGSPPFLNAAASLQVDADLSPQDLLVKLRTLESNLGRRRSGVKHEPRMIDLDLISLGDWILSTPELILPHPRAHLRKFVLAPLVEVAPDLILPGHTRTILQWLDEVQSESGCERLDLAE